MSTFEPPETTAAITAESRKLLELFGRAIRQATPERTQEWERKIERVLEDGRALIDEAELGERIQREFLEATSLGVSVEAYRGADALLPPPSRTPIRRFVVVGGRRRTAADEFKAATDDGREPPEAA